MSDESEIPMTPLESAEPAPTYADLARCGSYAELAQRFGSYAALAGLAEKDLADADR